MVLIDSSQVGEMFSLMCFELLLKFRVKRDKPAIYVEIVGEY